MTDRADATGFEQRITDWADSPPQRVYPPQCPTCVHLRDRIRWTCDAFSNGIPAPILTGDHDHTNPYPGDGGILYEPDESYT